MCVCRSKDVRVNKRQKSEGREKETRPCSPAQSTSHSSLFDFELLRDKRLTEREVLNRHTTVEAKVKVTRVEKAHRRCCLLFGNDNNVYCGYVPEMSMFMLPLHAKNYADLAAFLA